MSVYFNILDYGAAADGKTLCTDAFYKAIDAAGSAGGGTIYVPAGRFLTGPLKLASNLRLYLESGSEVLFSQEESDYPTVYSRWEGVEQEVYMPCIYAKDAENIIIEGMGTLNGQGEPWWEKGLSEDIKYPRPKLIGFQNCERIILRNIKLINSPTWTFNPICCKNILADGITIINPPDSVNTDGINPESCDGVRIQGCYISAGDDCVTLKSGTEKTKNRVPCQNITITNCVMKNGHGGVVIGSESSGDVRNVTISNCVFHKTDRGIRIKTRRGRGGTVEDIRVNNIIMDEVSCPFVINMYYYCGESGKDEWAQNRDVQPLDVSTPTVRRVYFSNITAKNVRSCAGFFYGLGERKIEDMSFDNILIMLGDGFKPEKPALLDYIEPMTKCGFYLGNTCDISFSGCTISGANGPAFYAERSKDILFVNCKAKNCLGPITESPDGSI